MVRRTTADMSAVADRPTTAAATTYCVSAVKSPMSVAPHVDPHGRVVRVDHAPQPHEERRREPDREEHEPEVQHLGQHEQQPFADVAVVELAEAGEEEAKDHRHRR